LVDFNDNIRAASGFTAPNEMRISLTDAVMLYFKGLPDIQNFGNEVGFEVLKAVSPKMAVFWVAAP
jgi:hypothetical protein